MVKFERLLADLDRNVLRGQCFRACVEMDFEELVDEGTRVNVRSNPTLLLEFDRAVKTMLVSQQTQRRCRILFVTARYVLFVRSVDV